MGLTYDGIIHRSLEEQVRYDAEQVELLKQADVTINENLQTVNESLQTINTEISGKLTKPTNPSAESAVTMLADGTVGTKLLSEIGGGKLYKQYLTLDTSTGVRLFLTLYTTNSENYTKERLRNDVGNFCVGHYSDSQTATMNGIIASFYLETNKEKIRYAKYGESVMTAEYIIGSCVVTEV